MTWTAHDEEAHSGKLPQEQAASARLGKFFGESVSQQIIKAYEAIQSKQQGTGVGGGRVKPAIPEYEIGFIGSKQAPPGGKPTSAFESASKSLQSLGYAAQGVGFKAMIASSTLQGVVSSVQQFAQPIDQLFGYFKTGLEQLKGIASKQFKAFGEYETDRISAANDLRTSFTPTKYDKTPILNIDQSLGLVDKMRPQVIQLATDLPGSNADYLTAQKYTIDIAGRAAKGDMDKLVKYSLDLTKVTGLLGAVSGKGTGVINTGVNQFMATGKLTSQSALGRAFPEFKTYLQDTKQGAIGTEEQRAAKLMGALNKFFPKQVTDKYQDTFSTRIAAFQEELFGETGIFSFVRNIDGGESIGNRLKKFYDNLLPDFKPLGKVVDRAVVALEGFLKPIANKAAGILKGSGERLAAMPLGDFLKPDKLFSALTGLTPDQNAALIKSVFDWITNLIKSLGESMRGAGGDKVVKALIDGITGAMREFQMQKLAMAAENAPALFMADPMAGLGVVASAVQAVAGVIMILAALPSALTAFGAAIGFVWTVVSGVGVAFAALGTIVLAVGTFIASTPILLVGAIAALLGAIVSVVVANWISITKFIQSTWQKLIDFMSGVVQSLNPIGALQNGYKAVESAVKGAVGVPAPPSAPSTAPAAPKKVEVSLSVSDRLGTLNSVTKDNLISALGEALSSQYGSLFEQGYGQA